MGRKRRRSEVSSSDLEETDTRKRRCVEKWTVADSMNKQVGALGKFATHSTQENAYIEKISFFLVVSHTDWSM